MAFTCAKWLTVQKASDSAAVPALNLRNVAPETGRHHARIQTATDLDGDTVAIDALNSALPGWPTHMGGLTFEGTAFQVDVGTTSFTIAVTDRQGGSDVQMFDFPVANVNDPPVALTGPVPSIEETPFNADLSVLASDADGDILTFTGSLRLLNGTVIMNTNGFLSHAPNTDSTGLASLSIRTRTGTCPARKPTTPIPISIPTRH